VPENPVPLSSIKLINNKQLITVTFIYLQNYNCSSVCNVQRKEEMIEQRKMGEMMVEVEVLFLERVVRDK
jgi:hypothetical protein